MLTVWGCLIGLSLSLDFFGETRLKLSIARLIVEAIPMTKIHDDVQAANKSYVEGFGDKGNLAMPPARHFAILTCMDARLDPAKFAGLAEGDAQVRNAGGRASDDGNSLAYYLSQAARHARMVRDPSHRLWHGDIH